MKVDHQEAKRLIVVLASAAALWVGCDSHEEGTETAVGPATGAVCPPSQTLTYDNFGKDFMQRYCQRCHGAAVTGEARQGAPSDHSFDSLDAIQGLRDHIDQLAGSGPAATNVDMPRGQPAPSVEERKKLSEWLACGAP